MKKNQNAGKCEIFSVVLEGMPILFSETFAAINIFDCSCLFLFIFTRTASCYSAWLGSAWLGLGPARLGLGLGLHLLFST